MIRYTIKERPSQIFGLKTSTIPYSLNTGRTQYCTTVTRRGNIGHYGVLYTIILYLPYPYPCHLMSTPYRTGIFIFRRKPLVCHSGTSIGYSYPDSPPPLPKGRRFPIYYNECLIMSPRGRVSDPFGHSSPCSTLCEKSLLQHKPKICA